jgi:transcription termination/antitermination protein NusG
MAGENLHQQDLEHELSPDEGQQQLSSDAAYGDEDDLEVDAGVPEDEIHPEAEDGVHGLEHETIAEPVAAPEEHAPPPGEALGPMKHWYIIHAYSGFEQKVAESLKTRAQAFGFADRLGQVLIPTEEVVELRSGKKVTSKRLL